MRGQRLAILGRPSWAGGVTETPPTGKGEGPKRRQATYLCLAPQGEFMKPLGMQALTCDVSRSFQKETN